MYKMLNQEIWFAGALCCTLLVASVFSHQAYAQSEEKQVNILFWFDYVPDEVVSGFEKTTGIKVVYDTFESLESMEAKLLAGTSGYDVALPSALVANRLLKTGMFAKLNKSKLTNIGNLDPKITNFLARHDPGNVHGVPYLWGTTGVIYNPALIGKRMENAPIDSLDMFFKPEIVEKFADCGVAMIDSPEEIIAVALNYLGLDPFTDKQEDLDQAGALLKSIRPHIRHFNTGSIINEMVSGDLCLTLGWSGDAGTAYARALEIGNGVEVFYSVPKEGTEIFFDFMTVLSDAPHPQNAHVFINYLMEPEVIANVTNTFYYPNGNLASREFVSKEILEDPSVYPPAELMAKLFPNIPREHATQRKLTRMWTNFKTGR